MKSLLVALICVFTVLAAPVSRTILVSTETGDFYKSEYSDLAFQTEIQSTPSLLEAPEILWHFSDPEGPLQKNAYLNYNYEHVFSGGWYSPGTLYDGYNGDGSIIWQVDEPELEPDEYCQWLRTGVAVAKTTDIFYQAQVWNVYNNNGTPDDYSDDFMVSEGNTSVKMFTSASETPVWSYQETGGSGAFIAAWIDSPGKVACSDDGSIFAISGTIDDHLAILFFNSDGTAPYLTYENTDRFNAPRQVRLTADGSKCIFRENGKLFRVDTATGVLEDTHTLEASVDCFAISPDGSVVAYGYVNARIATWDGSNYTTVVTHSVPSHYGGAAAIAADNETVYFGFRRSSSLGNRILRFDVSSSTPVWTYDYPIGSGILQDGIKWMDCSDDGEWVIAGSWGCETGGGNEVQVFNDDDPTSPVFTINTPGSMYHVSMSADGRYAIAVGKNVHANVNGAGTDLYYINISDMGIESPPITNLMQIYSISPNPVINQFTVEFSIPIESIVAIKLFDLSGRVVHNLTEQRLSEGTHSMIFNTNLNTGIYLCNIAANGSTATTKLVITN